MADGVLFFVYISVLFCDATLLFFRFRQADTASRFLCILIWLALALELTAKYMAVKFQNNMPAYTIYGFLEFALVSLYFNYSIDTFRKHHWGIIIAIAGVSIGIANSIWYQPFNTLNTLYIFLECIGIVCMSLYSFYRLLLGNTTFRLHERIHFWFPCIFLFNWCATFSSWGLYDHFAHVVQEKLPLLNISLLIVNIIVYLSFGLVFLFYPKMKSIHE